jgi:hypothetical protein
LELFHTNSSINYSTRPTTINTPLGGIAGIENIATMLTEVKTGWRIYDPKSLRIIDEFPLSKTLTFNGSGINPIAAASALLDRKEAVKQCGYAVAQQYSGRILPYYQRVNREYYIKGSPNFDMATRNARIGRWDNAKDLWQKEVNNLNPKIMARACYNMAISNEIDGNIDAAIDWAQKAYITGNNRLALQYVNQLKYRKMQVNRLEEQEEAEQ